MDEMEILQTIDEARRAIREDFDVPWTAPEEAARIAGALPKVHARMLRRVLRGLHQWFVGRIDEERGGLEAGGTPACSRCPHAKAARGVRESSGGSSATESRDTMDLLTWGKTYLPQHFLKPPSAMHRWMAEKLDGMAVQRGTKLNVLGPRGGAKSTLATLAYPLREALHRREPYLWILSDTAEQARAHLENLKAELIDNPQIARTRVESPKSRVESQTASQTFWLSTLDSRLSAISGRHGKRLPPLPLPIHSLESNPPGDDNTGGMHAVPPLSTGVPNLSHPGAASCCRPRRSW